VRQGLGKASKGLYPKVSDSTVIFVEAKFIRNISIGKNVVVEANAVVLNDIPDSCIAIGVPAKIRPQA
jgi:serine O-acetyltransferase